MKTPRDPHPEMRARDWVAIVLAIGLATALNMVVAAVLWTAISGTSDGTGGLSENGTQVITGAFGGIIGVLGSYLGFRAGERTGRDQPDTEEEPEPSSPQP